MYQAPATTNLSSPNSAAAGVPGGDALACAALTAARQDPTVGSTYQPYPTNPCSTSLQWQWLVQGNPDLQPEESKNWGAGLVWSPSDAMSFALDYYDIEIENVIGEVPRALAFALGNAGQQFYGVTRGPQIIAPNGAVLPGPATQILLPTVNGTRQTARGIDFEGMYRFETDAMGNFTTRLSWSHMLEFNELAVGTTNESEFAGTAGYPEDRAQLTLGWDQGDFAAAAIANYIGDSSDGTPATSLPSWTTWDLQGSVKLPWNGKVTIGVRNVGNKMPPFRSSLYGFPFYDNTIYNIWGRTPYIRYEQNF
jgi:iron complex outermembrane receptor protein